MILTWPLPTSLGADMGKKRSECHIILDGNSITNCLTGRIGIIWNFGPVVIGHVHEILKERLDV